MIATASAPVSRPVSAPISSNASPDPTAPAPQASAFAAFGLRVPLLRAVASEAEQAARAGKLQDVAALLPRVEEQAKSFKAALRRAGWLR